MLDRVIRYYKNTFNIDIEIDLNRENACFESERSNILNPGLIVGRFDAEWKTILNIACMANALKERVYIDRYFSRYQSWRIIWRLGVNDYIDIFQGEMTSEKIEYVLDNIETFSSVIEYGTYNEIPYDDVVHNYDGKTKSLTNLDHYKIYFKEGDIFKYWNMDSIFLLNSMLAESANYVSIVDKSCLDLIIKYIESIDSANDIHLLESNYKRNYRKLRNGMVHIERYARIVLDDRVREIINNNKMVRQPRNTDEIYLVVLKTYSFSIKLDEGDINRNE